MSVKSDYSDIEIPDIPLHKLMFMRFHEYADKIALVKYGIKPYIIYSRFSISRTAISRILP